MIDCTQVILDCDAHIRYAGYFKKIEISVIWGIEQTLQSIVIYQLCLQNAGKGLDIWAHSKRIMDLARQ